MSLRVDDRGRSGRSRSRTRDRSRSDVQRGAEAPPPPPSSSSQKKSRQSRYDPEETVSAPDAPEPGPGYGYGYDYRQPSAPPPLASPGLGSLASGSHTHKPIELSDDDDEEDERDRRGRHGYGREGAAPPPPPPTTTTARQYGGEAQTHNRSSSYSVPYPMAGQGMPSYPIDISTSHIPNVPSPAQHNGPQYPVDNHNSGAAMPYPEYSMPGSFQYASPPDKITYTAKSVSSSHAEQPPPPKPTERTQSYSYDTQVREAKPRNDYGQSGPHAPPPGRGSSYTYDSQVRDAKARENQDSHRPAAPRTHSSSVSESTYEVRAPSNAGLGLGHSMSQLSVGGRSDMHGGYKPGQAPPASPLLEAYHGTYQSISPMPMAIRLPEEGLDDLPPLSPIHTNERDGRHRSKSDAKGKSDPKAKKRVKIYDAESDAKALSKAMSHSQARPDPLIDILPGLTHDQLLELRDEYKKNYKVQGKGINIAKHIKSTTSGNFGKACYVTALGRWESESYWANFWYQSHSSSRELLIESIIGRSNADIREIKDSFKDKKYSDSLSKCMEKELKPDKFRTAVLLALDGRRQEETEAMPVEYRNRDVDMLHQALTGREGGESAIIQIVITRSDNHLREVLKTYERMHGVNFAREALKKSKNLVGEVIAHVLNGVINRPSRDSLLLRHAIDDISSKNKAADLRYELLMSRLIRLHWDRLHLARVKEEYLHKYHVELEHDLHEATKGDFGDFCLRLCET